MPPHQSPSPDSDHTSSSSNDPCITNNDNNLPIAIRKVVRASTQHPTSHFVLYNSLSPSFRAFISLCQLYVFRRIGGGTSGT